jgi:hypothetical protein
VESARKGNSKGLSCPVATPNSIWLVGKNDWYVMNKNFGFQREQLRDHEERVARLENELDDHRKNVPERGAKALTVQNHKEKDAFLQFEVICPIFCSKAIKETENLC